MKHTKQYPYTEQDIHNLRKEMSDREIADHLKISRNTVTRIGWKRNWANKDSSYKKSNSRLGMKYKKYVSTVYVAERHLNEFLWEKPVENRYWEKLDWFEVYNPVNPFLRNV